MGPKLGLWKCTPMLSSKAVVRHALSFWDHELWWLCQPWTLRPSPLSHSERTWIWSQHQENKVESSSPGEIVGAFSFSMSGAELQLNSHTWIFISMSQMLLSVFPSLLFPPLPSSSVLFSSFYFSLNLFNFDFYHLPSRECALITNEK